MQAQGVALNLITADVKENEMEKKSFSLFQPQAVVFILITADLKENDMEKKSFSLLRKHRL